MKEYSLLPGITINTNGDGFVPKPPELRLVTITGADDSTNIEDMNAISKEFPFVEWAILVSESQEGSYRFPSREWMTSFSNNRASHKNPVNTSVHLCGKWVRQLVKEKLDWSIIPLVNELWNYRLQVNTHAQPHKVGEHFISNLRNAPKNLREIIFQWDDINNNLARLVKPELDITVSALFDTSGGAGILPDKWPEAPDDIRVGFAGGLGPENVVEEFAKIKQMAKQHFWIDMERRVRTEDDSALDLDKVYKVLSLMKDEIN